MAFKKKKKKISKYIKKKPKQPNPENSFLVRVFTGKNKCHMVRLAPNRPVVIVGGMRKPWKELSTLDLRVMLLTIQG